MKINKTKGILILIVFVLVTSFKMEKISDSSIASISEYLWKNETQNKSLKILVISDLNSSYGSLNYSPDVADVISRLHQIKPDLILCGGDMVAGQKASLTEENIKEMWRSFNQTVLKPIQQLKIPFGFTLGNHDASPGYSQDRALASQFWREKIHSTGLTFVDNTNYPFYFSYLKNNVFIMSWDASGAKIKPEIFSWMKEQLRSRTAKKARLRILLGHLPLYPIVASKNKPGEVNSDADGAMKFFKEYGVDLYISGHQHAYFPAHKNGVQLLNAGCIGDGPRPILKHSEPAKKSYTIIEVPVRFSSPERFTYKTFVPQTGDSISIASLPDSVTGINGTIRRRDVKY